MLENIDDSMTYSQPIPLDEAQAVIEQKIDEYKLKEHFNELNCCTVFRNNEDPSKATTYKMYIYMYDKATDNTSFVLGTGQKLYKDPVDFARIQAGQYAKMIWKPKYNIMFILTINVAGGNMTGISAKWDTGREITQYNDVWGFCCPYSTFEPVPYLALKNTYQGDKAVKALEQSAHSRFPLVLRKQTNSEVCTGYRWFAYTKLDYKLNRYKECMTWNMFNWDDYSPMEGSYYKLDTKTQPEKWSSTSSGIDVPWRGEPDAHQFIYTNSKKYGAYYESGKYPYKGQVTIIYVNNPYEIGDKGYTDKDCDGQQWIPPEDSDSSLSGPIKDLLDQHKKTFYLLGKKTGENEPKLYLFDLGQVGGVLTYSHIKDAIVYKQVKCNWVQDDPNVQDLKFSSLEGEIDTNFYLLTPDKIDKPSKITKITLRKANEYLVKYFSECRIPKPEGGGDPNDDLKPDFGGGSGGGNGDIGGGGGFFPDVNNPLPNPEVPPCSGTDGGSQTPVSEIYLLKVPELTPSYDDTYDFPTKEAQHAFFIGRSDNIGLKNYSYLRKENAIQVGSHVDSIMCYNYLMYKNKAGKWYYCFIMDKQYINERTTRIIIATDVMQTYLFDYSLGPCYVERCHVPRWKPNGTPTDEFEPEGLEFGEPIQIASYPLQKGFTDTYIAVSSNPLGVIPSRQKTEEKTNVIEVEGGTDDGRKTISN